MSKAGLSKLWSSVAVALLYLTWNALAGTFGLGLSLPGLNFDEKHAHVAALFGAIGCAVLLLVLQWLWAHYLKLHRRRDTWHERVPPLFGADTKPSTVLGRRLQTTVLLLFVGVPLLTQLILFLRVIDGTVYDRASRPVAHRLSHFTGFRWPGRDDYRYGDPDRDKEKLGGVSFWPGVEPWALLVLQGAAVGLTVKRLLRG